MHTTVDDLMVKDVKTISRSTTVDLIRIAMDEAGISCVPVVDDEGCAAGIVSKSDVLEVPSDSTPASLLMSTKVFTVPQYADPSVAARVMRNHGIHHVVVTHEQRVVGILSAFDLLRLVEDHRFVMKQGPSANKKRRNHI